MVYHTGNQLIDPYLLFEKAHLQVGMHVADLGCGRTGHIVFPAAPIIGERGVLYAVDIMKDVLAVIAKRAALESLTNIQTVWSDIERVGVTAIPEKSLNVAFLVNILFHAKDITNMLNESKRLLKDKSRLLVVDWIPSSLSFSPSKDKLINFNTVKGWATENNFTIQEEFEAGKHHRGVVIYKNE